MLLWPAALLDSFYIYPPDHPLYRRSRVPIQLPPSSSSFSSSPASESASSPAFGDRAVEACRFLDRNFPRFVQNVRSQFPRRSSNPNSETSSLPAAFRAQLPLKHFGLKPWFSFSMGGYME